MSGQSWSRREAPWGARAIYSASARANASITGPRMVIAKKKNVRVTKDELCAPTLHVAHSSTRRIVDTDARVMLLLIIIQLQLYTQDEWCEGMCNLTQPEYSKLVE